MNSCRTPVGTSEIAVFWDYENCSVPSHLSGYSVVQSIRTVAHRFGVVKSFKAYAEIADSDNSRAFALRSELQSSGVSMTDCPKNGQKHIAEQMMIVDMLMYAVDHTAPATLVLISGDRDFAYTVSTLRLRGHEVIVISPTLPGAHVSLRSQASLCLDWNVDVLGSPARTLPDEPPCFSAPRSPLAPTPIPVTRKWSYAASTTRSDSETTVIPSGASPTPPAQEIPSAPVQEPEPAPEPEPVPVPELVQVTEPVPTLVVRATAVEPQAASPAPPYQVKPVAAPSSLDIPQMTSTLGVEPAVLTNERPSVPELVTRHIAASPFSPFRETSYTGTPVTPAAGPSARPVAPSPQASNLAVPVSGLRLDPSIFKPLIECLQSLKEKGQARPLRSVVGAQILSLDPHAYVRAGVSKFSDFVALAEQRAVVELGGTGGSAWIGLASPPIPPAFLPLVRILEQYRSQGVPRVSRSLLGSGLNAQSYLAAGVAGFKQFIVAAEAAHVICTGGTSNTAWISLPV